MRAVEMIARLGKIFAPYERDPGDICMNCSGPMRLGSASWHQAFISEPKMLAIRTLMAEARVDPDKAVEFIRKETGAAWFRMPADGGTLGFCLTIRSFVNIIQRMPL